MPDDPPFPPLTLTVDSLAANRGGRAVFHGVSFGLQSGDALAVMGPNGVGKSTLLRMLAGLLRPSDGTVVFAPAADAEGGPRQHYLGHLDCLKGGLTVGQNAEFWAKLWQRDAAAVDAALDTVGIAGLFDLPVAVLSAGQRRRAALARLLIARRPLWLLDEPTASLDQSGTTILGSVIAAHLAHGGIAVIATHAELPVPPTHLLTLGVV